MTGFSTKTLLPLTLAAAMAKACGGTPLGDPQITPNVAEPPRPPVPCLTETPHCVRQAVTIGDIRSPTSNLGYAILLLGNRTLYYTDLSTPDRMVPLNMPAPIVDIASNGAQLIAADEDGWTYTISWWAGRTNISLVEGLRDIVQVSAGMNFMMALDRSGIIYTWGQNAHGQLGRETGRDPDHTPRPVVSSQRFVTIEASGTSAYAFAQLGNQRMPYSWGSYRFHREAPCDVTQTVSWPNLLSAWVSSHPDSLSCHAGSCFIISGNQVYGFGCNANGQLGTADTEPHGEPRPVWSGVSQAAMGQDFGVIIDSAGAVFISGRFRNYPSQPDGRFERMVEFLFPQGDVSVRDNEIVAITRDGSTVTVLGPSGPPISIMP